MKLPMAESPGIARVRGVLSPVVTPFDVELRPDVRRFVRHCRWLLDQGVGLAVFGTNLLGDALRDVLDPRLRN